MIKKRLSFYIFLLLLFISCTPSKIDETLFISHTKGFHNLLWTEKEINNVSERISNSELYLYEKATENNFRKVASKAKILHFATHTIIDNENPMYSRLVLRADKTGKEDGYINTYELYNLSMNADLAVLSGCNTGIGKLVNNEGIMSLARGFKYAGCSSIIVTLWSVDDKTTAYIMSDFYKHLSNGKNISSSLRDAKLEYISTTIPETAAPFYWAGLTNIGQNKVLELKPRNQLFH